MALIICQICIFCFGASAVWLVGRTESWRRWGYISGFCGGPFWLYVTAVNNQWGIFALSLFYSYSWGQGIWNYWIKPWRDRKKGKGLEYAADYSEHYSERSLVDKDDSKSMTVDDAKLFLENKHD